MTITEAIAVHTVLRKLIGEKVPTVGVDEAGQCLLKRAYAVLMAGMRPEEWSEKWRESQTKGYRRVVRAAAKK